MSGYRCTCGRFILYGRCGVCLDAAQALAQLVVALPIEVHTAEVGSIAKAYDALGVDFVNATVGPWAERAEARLASDPHANPFELGSLMGRAGLPRGEMLQLLTPKPPRFFPMRHASQTRRALSALLHRLGFERDGKSRDPLMYVQTYAPAPIGDHRRVEVQLWKDGRHRVSHMLLCPTDHNRAVGSTTPTSFFTPEGLGKAIDKELSRVDHTNHGSWA